MIDLLWTVLGSSSLQRPLSLNSVPKVLAIIPDGNRRWARRLGKLGSYGHDAGLERCREVVKEAFQLNVSHVALWVTSWSNLTERSESEVSHLIQLLKQELRRVITEAEANQYRFRIIGSWKETRWGTDQELLCLADEAEEATRAHTERHFSILFGYDFRRDMAKTIGRLQALSPNFLSLTQAEAEEVVSQNLSTGFLGDVDFVVRTGSGGDPHWSASFLGWNIANAQLYFTDTPWPAFGRRELLKALNNFAARERRAGK